jgi:hypothetical protein
MAEQTLLNWMPQHGSTSTSPPKTAPFGGGRQSLPHRAGFTIYSPSTFNYTAVDSIMSHPDDQGKAIVVELQIIMSINHRRTGNVFYDWGW